MSFVDIALPLTEMNFNVFPVNGKIPLIRGWKFAATTDPSKLEAWSQQFPDANVGIATGNSLLVIDIDDLESETAKELLPMLPATLCARTGRPEGMHQFYKVPTGTFSVATMKGVDLRGDGGFVVGAGSIHANGRVYEWVDASTAIAVLPQNVIEMLKERIKRPILPTVVSESGDGLIGKGDRHTWLRKQVFAKAMQGRVSQEELMAITANVLLAQVEDGDEIGGAEVENLVQGAYQKRRAFRTSDLTESGLADMFHEYYKDNLIRLESGEWLYQENGIWSPCVSPEGLFKPVREVVYSVNLEAAKASAEGDTKYVNSFHEKSGAYRFTESVIKFAKPMFTKKIDDFTSPPDTLPFKEGLLDLVSGTFRPFRPEDNVIETMNCSYDPSAKADRWEETVLRVTGGEPEIVRYLKQIFGYFLSTRTGRSIFYFLGPKSTAKTTLVSCLAEIMGKHLAGVAQLGLIHKTRGFGEDETDARQNIALVGRRFVYLDEARAEAEVDCAKMKRIASRDSVLTARHLRFDSFEFVNHCKVVVLTNSQPKIDPSDGAAYDRVVLVPFLTTIPKEDRIEGFKDILLEEAAGILNWCIEGFQDYNANGFIQPAALQDQIQSWAIEDSPLAQFVDEVLTLDFASRVNVSELYEKYIGWKIQAGIDEKTGRYGSPSAFGKEMKRMFSGQVDSSKSNGTRYLTGLRIGK